MCLWATRVLRIAIGVTILCLENILPLQMSSSLSRFYFFTSPSFTSQSTASLHTPLLMFNIGIEKVPQPQPLQVYSRRLKMPTLVLHPSDPPSLVTGSSHHQLHSDHDLLIAIRKGKHSSTTYSLSCFISYDKITSSFRQLTLSLSFVSILNHIKKLHSSG